MKKYTNEKNVLMLISLLKQHNIRRVITSPGAMNVTFVGSIQDDDFFEIYSCVDERSACYMACGMAEESGEPVVLSCTGATSSRNYIPGLTEAYYRRIPILAVTSAKHLGEIGHNIPQVLDRTNPLNDIVKKSVQVPTISSTMDEWACNVAINDALLELNHKCKGPVHINLITTFSKDYSVKELPNFRKIIRIDNISQIQQIPNGKIGIFVGNHSIWDERLKNEVQLFCEKYNAIVLCDKTSNYYGKYRIEPNILIDQDNYKSDLYNFDLIIHIGNVSGAYMDIVPKNVWRVDKTGKLIDTFKKLTTIYEMDEYDFFHSCNQKKANICIDFYEKWENAISEIREKIDYNKIPFSNIWISNLMSKYIPEESIIHFAILNSLRAWNYTSCKKIKGYCNTGGFGIDGILSTVIGASLVNKNINHYCIIGDLAFFYDMNSLGNINIGNNLRILLINNGCGTEFHNYTHNAQVLGEKVSRFVAADGHYGNKSNTLVKNLVENLGFDYISANNKDDFSKLISRFCNDEIYDKSLVFEVFTDSKDESDALKMIRNIKSNPKEKVENIIKSNIPVSTKNKIKSFLGKQK